MLSTSFINSVQSVKILERVKILVHEYEREAVGKSGGAGCIRLPQIW